MSSYLADYPMPGQGLSQALGDQMMNAKIGQACEAVPDPDWQKRERIRTLMSVIYQLEDARQNAERLKAPGLARQIDQTIIVAFDLWMQWRKD